MVRGWPSGATTGNVMEPTRRATLMGGVAAPFLAAQPRLASAKDAGGKDAGGKDAATPTYVEQARRGVEALIKSRAIPGVAAALIVDGAPVWTAAYGETGGQASRPVDLDTIFSLQSTSKNICATAVMMAVQRGLVGLDTPITAYLPDFSVNSRHEADPQHQMTLRWLMSHHAGFTHEAPVGNNYASDSETTPADFQAHIESIKGTWLRYPVGERFAYSNLGVDLAGHILERVTGLAYPEILRRWIFAPLGMRRTTASADVYAVDTNRAVGHSPPFQRIPVRIPIVPSGGVYSCVTDMAKYAQFHLRRGASERGRLLDAALWEEMHTFRYGAPYALGVARHDLRLPRRTLALYTHDGGGFGFGSCFFYAPTEGVSWIVLFNSAQGDNPFDRIMPDALFEARYGSRLAAEPNPNPAITLPNERLQALTGLYMEQDSRCVAQVRDGALWLKFENAGGENRLTFISETEAWVTEGPRRPSVVKFHPARGLEAQHFELPAGSSWDFIDGPSVGPGPTGPEYDQWLGTYEILIWGSPAAKIRLTRRNGWLYYNDQIRAVPFAPGIFFGGTGEALDLRGPVPTARNIPLQRVT